MGSRERDEFWKRAMKALVAIALSWRVKEAEDAAQSALVIAFQKFPDETDCDAFVRRAAGVMKLNLKNERRKVRRRADEAWLANAADAERPLARTPEQLVSVAERKANLMALLNEALADDEDARAIVEKVSLGVLSPAEQAEALGWDYERVRNVRKRVDRAVQAVGEEHAPSPDSARGWSAASEIEQVEDGEAES